MLKKIIESFSKLNKQWTILEGSNTTR